jgi:predicted amidohydrolase
MKRRSTRYGDVVSRLLRVAVAQYEPRVGDVDANRALAERWVSEAAGQGAQLIVLPELASSGYVFADEGEAAASAEPAQGGPFVRSLEALCARHGCVVVAGLNELGDERRHNSAAVVAPEGLVGTYRKLHLFNDERSWFTPGERLTVFETPAGRVGIVICYDLRFPEAGRALALAGAEIIAVPTNWVASFKHTVWDERGYCQGDYLAMATAGQNGVVVACADRVGVEREVRFIGASIIVGPEGWPAAGPAGGDTAALLVADVDLDDVERFRRSTPRNHLLDDRRPDAYHVEVRRAPSLRA